MSGKNGGFSGFDNELSTTNYSNTSNEQHQHLDPELLPYSSDDTQRYQGYSREHDGWETFEANENINSSSTATAYANTGYSQEAVDQRSGRHRREQEVYEIGALRAYHRALKEDKERSSRVTEDTRGGSLVERTTHGDEYKSFGQRLPHEHGYGHPRSVGHEDSDDDILPHDDQMSDRIGGNSAYGRNNPPSNYLKYPSQELPNTDQYRKPHPNQPIYGYDQPLANPIQYGHQEAPPSYPGQPFPEWQGGTFSPNTFNQGMQGNGGSQPFTPVTKIPDYYTLSIIVIIFFSWPFGLIALRRANAANAAKRQGNYIQAMEHAKSSYKWNIWGIFIGLLCHTLIGVFIYYRIKLSH